MNLFTSMHDPSPLGRSKRTAGGARESRPSGFSRRVGSPQASAGSGIEVTNRDQERVGRSEEAAMMSLDIVEIRPAICRADPRRVSLWGWSP